MQCCLRLVCAGELCVAVWLCVLNLYLSSSQYTGGRGGQRGSLVGIAFDSLILMMAHYTVSRTCQVIFDIISHRHIFITHTGTSTFKKLRKHSSSTTATVPRCLKLMVQHKLLIALTILSRYTLAYWSWKPHQGGNWNLQRFNWFLLRGVLSGSC